MADEQWPELGGKEVRFQDHTWRLTGDVDVRSSGDVLAFHARQVDDVRGQNGWLFFDVVGGDSLNPGDSGEHFDSLTQTADGYELIVKQPGSRYQYELARLEYD
jgi:hypothetical protein